MPEGRLEIDPDITRASTLPAEVYGNPAIFEAQRRRLFPRAWQFAADAESVRGQTPFSLPALDDPLLLTRDGDGRVHALSNVCTHRGNVLVHEPCLGREIVCRYHGRRFRPDGSFAFMPGFEEARGFPSKADDLPRVPLGAWSRFLFASLAPDVPFDEWIGPLRARLEWVRWEEFAAPERRDYEVKANWALYCDNYLEGFHIPYVHQALNAVLDVGQYRTELDPWGVMQTGVPAAGEPAFETGAAAYYYWLFPTTMFNLYPWGLSLNLVVPLAPDRTRVTYLSFVRDASKRARGAGAGLDRVELEDEAVVESVQRGVRSRLYRRGRYSPTQERGVHHFHRLLVRYLEGNDP